MHFLLSAFRFLLTNFSLLPDMSKLTFLITAGPTQEPVDPVRYLSNRSSGKMGYALAKAARAMGHRVLLISGPTSLAVPKGVKLLSITTASDMHRAVMRNFRTADVIIKVAAVADYRPAWTQSKKIKKTGKPLTLKLIPSPDILKELGRKKRKNQILVGFAAETDRGLPN
ncbi:MAG: phosphopantothenoylcysteine decarboxylase, partial [Deltaproteobacteria bacterium]|nr:phosphopantothenoylcysteine decarboxylase [Deltaproteobacteria bacterium]